jgi:hypothetical protein
MGHLLLGVVTNRKVIKEMPLFWFFRNNRTFPQKGMAQNRGIPRPLPTTLALRWTGLWASGLLGIWASGQGEEIGAEGKDKGRKKWPSFRLWKGSRDGSYWFNSMDWQVTILNQGRDRYRDRSLSMADSIPIPMPIPTPSGTQT